MLWKGNSQSLHLDETPCGWTQPARDPYLITLTQPAEPDSLTSIHLSQVVLRWTNQLRTVPRVGSRSPQLRGPKTEKPPVQRRGWEWNEVSCDISRNVALGGQNNSYPLYAVTSCSHTLDFTRREKHVFSPFFQIHIHCPEALDLSAIFGKRL